ncbi:hypothetical protein Tco_1521126 [Tanacetum coccineum]
MWVRPCLGHSLPSMKWLSPRDISREGFNLQSHVVDLVSNNGWLWPQDWLLKATNLGLIHAPNLDVDSCDTHCWRDLNGSMTTSLKKAHSESSTEQVCELA